jgi:hypothetical protein
MVPFVAIVVKGEDETWHAYMPDFSDCHADGESVETALARGQKSGAGTKQWCGEADTARLDGNPG